MSNQKIIQNFVLGTTIDNYNVNKFFEDYVLQKDYYPYQFDGWKEKQFYGLVDSNNRAIYPKDIVLSLNSNDNGVNYRSLIFVTDAFQEMKKYHKSFLTGNRFVNNGSIYTALNITAGTPDIASIYIDYLNKLFSIFSNSYLVDTRKNNIKDFNSFLTYFISFTKLLAPFMPITRSSFIKSKLCPLEANGLSLQFIDNKIYDDTKAKADSYISDPNFDPFLDSAKRFGFFVDRNAPWRIVADLASPAMKKYYNQYGYETVDDVFANFYHVAYYSDLDILKNMLVSFWNTYANKQTYVAEQKEISGCSSLFAQVNTYNQISADTFDSIFNKSWIIRFYLFIKTFENNLSINQNKFEIIYNEAVKLDKYVDEKNMLDYIDRKMQELSTRGKQQNFRLTTADEMLKMLSEQQKPSIAEGINF
jgi:hypothetical protein